MAKKIYIAATNQHIGKTTSTLGLVKALNDHGVNVGYCKPVGQKFINWKGIKADKDAFLFGKMMEFSVNPDVHSPVILGSGATSAFLERPEDFHYKEDILNASRILEERHDLVVYEGTGHPGVGSIVNLSNADVAKMLDAPVVMIVEGGIGRTIDRLNMSIALFREKGVPIKGVIINKVLPEKMEKIKRLVGIKLDEMGLELFGCLPYQKDLSFPIMRTINSAIGGMCLLNEGSLDNMVESSISASLTDSEELLNRKNLLLVSHYKRLDSTIDKIKELFGSKNPLSGIILTGEGRLDDPYLDHISEIDYIINHKIPVVVTKLDTLGAVRKINKIEVKINTRTMWKVEKAVELIKQNVDLDRLIAKISE